MSSLDLSVVSDALPESLQDASTQPPPVPPDRPRPNAFRTAFVDHNPFFLLSALCMLGGCVAVTNSLSWSPVRLERILMLAVTINVYELLLVALAIVLLKRPMSRRDGSILLIVEAFFIVDVAFLNAELFAIDRWVGLAANAILFALALIKIGFIARAIGVRFTDPRIALAMFQILTIYALPGVLKFYATHNGGTLPALAMLIVWWAIFVIGVGAYSLLTHVRQYETSNETAPWFVPLLTIVGGLSLLAHAGTSQWIYDLRYWGADLAPVLALAACIFCSRPALRAAGVLCALAAVFASASYGPHLRMTAFGHPLTPVHLTMSIVYLVLAWTLARQIFLALVGVGAVAVAVFIFGPSIATIRTWLAWFVGRTDTAIEAVRPKTLAQWGVISIVLSFTLLAIGAVFSLRREPPEPMPERVT